VKKDEMKKRSMDQTQKSDRVTEAIIDLVKERALIWSNADPHHTDFMKVGMYEVVVDS
jgi:hypothetical protein